jgi:hypothetical protein
MAYVHVCSLTLLRLDVTQLMRCGILVMLPGVHDVVEDEENRNSAVDNRSVVERRRIHSGTEREPAQISYASGENVVVANRTNTTPK